MIPVHDAQVLAEHPSMSFTGPQMNSGSCGVDRVRALALDPRQQLVPWLPWELEIWLPLYLEGEIWLPLEEVKVCLPLEVQETWLRVKRDPRLPLEVENWMRLKMYPRSPFELLICPLLHLLNEIPSSIRAAEERRLGLRDHFQVLEIVVFELELCFDFGDPDDGGVAAVVTLLFLGEGIGAKFAFFGGAGGAGTRLERRHFGLSDSWIAVLLYCGGPGSGKSTIANLLAQSIDGVVINHDLIKSFFLENGMLFDQAATLAYGLDWRLAEDLIKQGRSVILDSVCNYNETLDRGTALAQQYGYDYKYVECRVDDIGLLDQRLQSRVSLRSQRTGVNRPPLDVSGARDRRDYRAVFERWMEDSNRPVSIAVFVDSTRSPEKCRDDILEQIVSPSVLLALNKA
ncbi:hypothetical protein LARI1_G000663 [Lachnellula arida]|uniref:Uncharacterized protein n=1 Tax=Lachnellula arida TaxID=1316785 RepID=A0A8T9BQ22_9HELO|nr:hypothetical protein LARI1_G000663 [Lachnellula arida]